MTLPVPEDWFVFFPLVWIGGWIAASVVYRRIHNKPLVPRSPADARYREVGASGVNDTHLLGWLGGANRCLLVVVTPRELRVSPFFPFNLMFVPEIYGLELRTSISSIRRVGEGQWGFRSCLTIEVDDGRRFKLVLKDPAAFRHALGKPG